jgi:hypothetical protein
VILAIFGVTSGSFVRSAGTVPFPIANLKPNKKKNELVHRWNSDGIPFREKRFDFQDICSKIRRIKREKKLVFAGPNNFICISNGRDGIHFGYLGHVNAAIRDSRALPLASRALERRARASVSIILVRSVAAIVLAVADHRVDDAARIVALEVILAAIDLTARVRFVRSVFAVFGAVAVPGPRDADARTGAVELLLLVALVGGQRRATNLVAAVVAVRNAVALVRLVDALLAVAAFQLLGRARDGRATFLVLVVETIIVAVADPRLRDAVAGTRASELEIGASPFGAEIWKEKKKQLNKRNRNFRILVLCVSPPSSLPSPQSFSESHFQVGGMQRPLSQVNWEASHVTLTQPVSSDESPQSLSESQRNELGMQRPDVHWNSSVEHVGLVQF